MALLCLIAMGADNHPTTVPSENSADSADSQAASAVSDSSETSREIEYADDPHGRYMRALAEAVGE